MKKVWLVLVLFCLTYGLVRGNYQKVAMGLFDSATDSLKMLLSIGSLIVFYNGIFQIAVDSNIIKKLTKPFFFLTRFLFPKLSKKSIIHEYTSFCIVSNILGLGIATTPIVLKILEEMKKDANTDKVTDEMITLILLNVVPITVFPMTLLSIREKYNTQINVILIIAIFILTTLLFLFALLLNKLFINLSLRKMIYE